MQMNLEDRFEDIKGSVIQDVETGLYWQKHIMGRRSKSGDRQTTPRDYSWGEVRVAFSYLKGDYLWDVPTIDELRTLLVPTLKDSIENTGEQSSFLGENKGRIFWSSSCVSAEAEDSLNRYSIAYNHHDVYSALVAQQCFNFSTGEVSDYMDIVNYYGGTGDNGGEGEHFYLRLVHRPASFGMISPEKTIRILEGLTEFFGTM